jgi:predicted 3-demethylubiquinone-9 3-methyltransferase (glyoxalase superfamily)
MKKITPCLWFDNKAEDAARFYTSIFKNSKLGKKATYNAESSKASGMPEGSLMTIAFKLEGQEFLGLNGGNFFKFTPATSFMVYCKTTAEVDQLWNKLSEGGKTLMELAEYPFSKRYGWLEDKYGVSWQIMQGKSKQKITPSILFVGKHAGKAKEAMKLYTKTFKKSKVNMVDTYKKGEQDKPGNIKYANLTLDGYDFVVMDSSYDHKFTITQAVSYIIMCKDQKEIDHFYKLAQGGQIQPCGWILDKYGVAWQITPANWEKLITSKNGDKYMHAMMQMKKLDMKKLEAAAKGK